MFTLLSAFAAHISVGIFALVLSATCIVAATGPVPMIA